jgi:hypothetical protein
MPPRMLATAISIEPDAAALASKHYRACTSSVLRCTTDCDVARVRVVRSALCQCCAVVQRCVGG